MRRREIMVISFCAILITIFLLVVTYLVINSPASTTIRVEPPAISRAVGQYFSVNVSICGVTDLFGWQLKIRWNSTILDAISVEEGAFLRNFGTTFFNQIIKETGYVVIDCTLLGEVSGVNGSGVVTSLQFYVKETGSCKLEIYDTILISASEQHIAHTVENGFFQ